MAKVLLLLLYLALGGVSLSVAIEENSKDPIASTLESLKEKSEREDFLSYVLGLSLLDWAKNQARPPRFFPIVNQDSFLRTLNISDEKIKEFRKIDIPEDSRMKLLTWTKSEFGLTSKDVLAMIRTKKCQGPNCIGLDELGPLCCPW